LLTVPLWGALGFITWLILSEQDSAATGDWPRISRLLLYLMLKWTLFRVSPLTVEEVWLPSAQGLWQAILVLGPGELRRRRASAVLGYLRSLQAPPADNFLYLQDQLWRQTRGEQSLLNRWLTWARLRLQRRKE